MAKKADYQIRVDKGNVSDGQEFHRVVTVVNSKRVSTLGTEKINEGFGATPKEAIDDFVRRNSSDVLNKIFD